MCEPESLLLAHISGDIVLLPVNQLLKFKLSIITHYYVSHVECKTKYFIPKA